MKNLLGSSLISLVLFSASAGFAQNPSPPSSTTAETPTATPPTTPTSPAANPTPPNPASPTATPASPSAPGLTSEGWTKPKDSSASTPTGPYGFSPPMGPDGWIVKKEIVYRGGPIPYGYKLDTKYNLGLLIAGPTLFGLSYLVATYLASSAEAVNGYNLSTRDVMYIPVTGPFAFAAYSTSDSTFLYVFDGLAQVTGVGLFLGGLLFPKDVLVPKDVNEAYRPSLRVGPGQVQLQMRF